MLFLYDIIRFVVEYFRLMKNMKFIALIFGLLLFNTAHSQFSFVPSTVSGCAPENITFTNTSSSGVIFDWNFGDGSSTVSNVTNPSHTYTDAGTYTAIMLAYDGSYSFLGQTELEIIIVGVPSEINMVSHTICPNNPIDMWYNVNTATNYTIDYGDGNSESNPYGQSNHTYTSPGVYNVVVSITTPSCGILVLNDIITVSGSIPYFGGSPYINISSTSACPNSLINGWGPNEYSIFAWDFGDGNTDVGNYVDFSYSAINNYTVSLTITNGCGVDTVLTELISVSASSPVTGEYIWEVDSICPGEEFNIQANSDNGTQYEWNFNDGNPTVMGNNIEYTINTPGIYAIDLTITNDCGNTINVPSQIVVTPNSPINNPYFSLNQNQVCPGDEIYFSTNDQQTHYIDFGDGTGSSTTETHVYQNTGTYPVSVVIQNSCGNSITLYDTVYVLDNLPINSNNIYTDINPTPSCPGDEVSFHTSSGFASYLWDFGNGNTSENRNTNHIFNTTGNHIVTLTLQNGCGSEVTVTTAVQISDNLPVGDIAWSVANDTICPNNSVYFEADQDDGSYDYLWDFGDGTTSTYLQTSHIYGGIGIYPIELVVSNGCGNDNTFVDTVIVTNSYVPNENDYSVFAQEEGCLGDELYFVVMPAGGGDIFWEFGDGTSTTEVDVVYVSGVSPVDVSFHGYSNVGQYYAKYTITNSCGNSLTDSLLVDVGTVGDPQDVDVSFWWDESQTACQGQPVEFTAVGGATYIWNFGDGSGQLITYSSLTPIEHIYTNSGTYSVMVQSINQCGNSDTRVEEIFIPESQINVVTNTITQANCDENNGLAVVSATGGIPPYTYSWTNGDESVIADSLYSGIYVVTVSDNNGCSNEGIATVSDIESVTILVDNVVDIDCYGANNGSISVSILGGQPPYVISWSNGDQTEDVFGLQAGPYEIFVTDANGCFAVESIIVTQPQLSNLSIITTPATCGGSNGQATASVNNGTGPYNFIWPNTTGPSNTTGGLDIGIHTLLVIDGNTCLLEQDFIINEQAGPIIITDSTTTGTCNGDLSAIYISTIGGQGPFTYSWSSGETTEDLTGILPGEYEIEIEGTNGCSSFSNFSVEDSQPEETTICMLDVDTLTNTNLIVWAPLNQTGIASYNIYKESSESGLYYLIGNQSADSISQYYDYLSDPSIRSWRYKVAAVDDCGNEAPLSNDHKTIHLTTNLGVSGEVNLIWDHYQGFSYSTYYINRWHPSTGWVEIDAIASSLFTYTDLTPPSDSNLVYMVSIVPPAICTAYKAQDHNASRSNTASINAPEDPQSDLGLDNINTELIIYPNPTNGVTKISSQIEILSIEVYDISGKLILFEGQINGTNYQINLSQYENGLYTIKITTDESVVKHKLIKT